MYGSADDYLSIDITKVTKGPYGVYAVYLKIVVEFLDQADVKSHHFDGIWEVLGTWCGEMGKCLDLLAPRPKVYVSFILP